MNIFSGCLGAFVAFIGDLAANTHASCVVKLADVISILWSPTMERGPLVALTMLVALGGSITLVFQPKSRQEAFSRGLALLAVVTVSTPLQESPGLDDPVRSEVSSFLGVSTAWADVKPLPVGTIELRVYTDVSGVLPQGAQIALRDLSTGRVVARQGLVRSIMTFSRPVGSYRLTVEAPSYETVVVDFAVVLERPATVEVRLYPSSLPGVFQKVLPPNTQKR